MSKLKRVFDRRFGAYVLYVCIIILFFGFGQLVSTNLNSSQQVWFFALVIVFFVLVCLVRWKTNRPLIPM